MSRARLGLRSVLVLLCIHFTSYMELCFSQTSTQASAATVQQTMTTALSRCYSHVNGVEKISFVSPTDQEFAAMKALGREAVAPLARYLDAEPKNGLTQLLAVKFLMAIDDSSTFGPLKRAVDRDQWEVTRAQALSGMFVVSQVDAKPYVEAALGDKSQLVRQRAQDLWALYQQQSK
jgi:hypothetical protein